MTYTSFEPTRNVQHFHFLRICLLAMGLSGLIN